VPLVTRAEAAQALRRAAELGHPFSVQMLIRQLEDGDIIKRIPSPRDTGPNVPPRQKTRAKEAC
jgi:hypothetical protein